MENNGKEKLFGTDNPMEREDSLLFKDGAELPEEKRSASSVPTDSWKVLLVDDEEDIHSVTRMALKGFAFRGKEIQFLHAYSGEEARQLLPKNKDIALIFLDVVMETNHAGLDLVKHIRDVLKNHFTQIVLRTGYPGQAPEREVIATYEINDYKTKTELTTFKLFTVTLASLRAYDSLTRLEDLRRNLERIVKERTADLERKNVKIMEMDQMKTRFFSNVSHEFRTPLTLILGPLEDFMVDKELSSNKKDTIEIMHRNALRLLGLVNQLLDLAKIDAGSMKLNLMYYDLHKALRLVSRGFVPLAERKKIKYNIRIPEETLNCFFDRDMMEKILVNLLSNAFKYTPDHGEIICHVSIEDQKSAGDTRDVELWVSDSGPGIPVEQLEKIFDRFYQVEDGWKKETSGTGIGLSLIKELTTLQHGDIRVESDPKKGSRFIVRLPVGKDHLKPNEYVIVKNEVVEGQSMIIKCSIPDNSPKESEDSYEITGNSDRPIVLVIDDSQDIRRHIRESLGADFLVKEAGNGKEGLEKAVAIIPDLIITDLMMPEMDGIELCRNLKTDDRLSHVPVIMLTAKAEVDHKIEGLQTGADDYITKPYNSKELITRTKNLIDQRNKLREKYTHQVFSDAVVSKVESVDERFLEQARKVIEKNISDCNFDVNSFYPEMGMSRMQLFRKLKALVNQTPGEIIRNLRLQRAAQLLKQNFGNVAEVTYEVGFNNLSYFAKCFREKYGMLPSDYQKQIME
ncbi:MAG: response regulator [Bacteroidales bacterium]|nr:response regulator [Bacteroidales bacterium]